MNSTEIESAFQDLQYVFEGISRDAERVVRKWTDTSCDDCKQALRAVWGLLKNSWLFNEPQELSGLSSDRYRVAVEILTRSNLKVFVEHDEGRNFVRFRADVPEDVMRRIAAINRRRDDTEYLFAGDATLEEIIDFHRRVRASRLADDVDEP